MRTPASDGSRRQAAEMVKLLMDKGVDKLLDCDWFEEDEYWFGGSAQIYHNGALIMVHPDGEDVVVFSAIPPPDDAHLVPDGSLGSFSVSRDFDPKSTARAVRKLCAETMKKLDELGGDAHLYEMDEVNPEDQILVNKDGTFAGDAADREYREMLEAMEEMEAELGEGWRDKAAGDDDGEGWKKGGEDEEDTKGLAV